MTPSLPWLDWLRSINPLDLVLGGVILASIVIGWSRGFLAATLQLLTLAGAVALAFYGYGYPAAWLEAHEPALGPWTEPLSFFALYLAGQLGLGAAARLLLRGVPERVHQHGLNRLLGMLPGAIAGLVHVTVISVLLFTIPMLDALTTVARGSVIANFAAAPAEWLEAKLQPIFDPAIRRTLQALTVQPESKTVIRLPFKIAKAPARPDLEARMLEMVNDERRKNGLEALRPDPQLTEVARAHSQDMFARGYFSHVSPDRRDPFDRLRAAKATYRIAGENLAFAHTLVAAHQGLMRSPGHRANILRPQFGRAGIAVLDGGMHGLMITQEFRN
jgi:uncharacterized protein YkwD